MVNLDAFLSHHSVGGCQDFCYTTVLWGRVLSEANRVLNWNLTCQCSVCVTLETANLGAFLEEKSEANTKCTNKNFLLPHWSSDPGTNVNSFPSLTRIGTY